MTDALDRLADLMGVADSWRDQRGDRHHTPPETKRALLTALGQPCETEAEAAESLAAREAERAARIVPEEIVAVPDLPARIPFTRSAAWRLEREDGQAEDGRAEDGVAMTLPAGVHRLRVEDQTCLIVAAPRTAPSVREIAGRDRVWGATGSIYGLRSGRNLGVGDYADLGAAAAALGGLGADFYGINPLHARGVAEIGISPYSPSSRIALEPGHIAVDRIPGFVDCAEARRFFDEAAEGVAHAREGDFARYDARAAAASPVLRALFDAFLAEAEDHPERRAFTAWAAGPGAALDSFAAYEALSLHHGADWRLWPERLRRPDAPAVDDFARAHLAEVAYQLWLQWRADRQLADAQAAALAGGMAFGLYLDLAVGVRPGGADAWAHPGAFARGVSLGAPPDPLAPNGQDWGLAPFSPNGLREAEYAPFRQTLRAALQHAGLLRIDHVIGLQHAWWAPEGGELEGGYVASRFETLLALIRLEARRAGAVVIGEDLGTVPEGLTERLNASGLHGCAILHFEREGAGFTPPRRYRQQLLASFGTHDLPTIRGWLRGLDIDWRVRVGHFTEEQAAEQRAERGRDIGALHHLLRAEGKAAEGEAGVVDGVHALLAESGAALVGVGLDDALGVAEQMNLPGTLDEHPNWRRRFPVPVEALAEDAGVSHIAATMRAARPRGDGAAGPEETP